MYNFFEEKQAAAVLKHGILRRYLPIFTTMTGSRAGEVAYLDGFAGPGLYDNGQEGSPALAIRTAKAVASMNGKASMRGHLIEKDAASVRQLRELLEDSGVDWPVYCGRAQDHVPEIVAGLDPSTPLFAFIDPFGLLIPFDQVASVLARGGPVRQGYRIKGAATELLLNFSVPGINRVGGQLTGTGSDPTWLKARATQIANVDAALGGDWWHPIWTSKAPDRVQQICAGYERHLLNAAGAGWTVFRIPAADRWDGSPSYYMLFMTAHPDGVWKFHDTVSLANEEYRKYCHDAEGRMDLDPLDGREARWVAAIKDNVSSILRRDGSFIPFEHIDDVYGLTFGEARTKHVKKALKELYKAGSTATDCTNKDIATLRIKAARARQQSQTR